MFGSTAPGEMRPDGDIDLLFVRPDEVDAENERGATNSPTSANGSLRGPATARGCWRRDEEFLALDVAPVGICESPPSSGDVGAEDTRVDDDSRSAGGHASAMALRKAASSSSVRPSIIISS